MIFFSAVAIFLIATGVLTVPAVIAQWRLRSEYNRLRLLEAYAEGLRLRDEARQAGERA